MASETVQRARDDFRQRRIPAGYSGPRHLATTVTLSLAVAVASIAMLESVRPLEWLTVPLTFLYANLSEYLGHRGPMHHKTRFLSAVFVRHTIEHHSFFTNEAPSFDTTQDYRAVLFPPVLVIFFLAAFALPVGALLYFVASPNVCFLFVATAMLYFLNYELLHFSYHCDPASTIGRLPFVARLRKHHLAHHNRKLMSHYNFNITYPICDWIFGTIAEDHPQKTGDRVDRGHPDITS